MHSISLYFRIHQPFRLSSFPFFDIGKGKNYFNEHLNSTILQKESLNYLGINSLFLKLIERYEGKFNVNFCISGTTLEQAQLYCPKLVGSFQELSETGGVEFIGTTYSNSLSALISKGEFARQVYEQSQLIQDLFSISPKAFQLSKLAYTDAIGEILNDLGFDKILLEGAISNLQDDGFEQLYLNTMQPGMVVLTDNPALSDEIHRIFGLLGNCDSGTVSKKFIEQLLNYPDGKGPIPIGLNYQPIVDSMRNGSNVLGFLEELITQAILQNIELIKMSTRENSTLKSASVVSPNSLSPLETIQEELLDYLGNDMQREAFYSLYELEDTMTNYGDSELKKDWVKLQSSDHFYYMDTGQITSDHKPVRFSPYSSPFQAFINYMNVLSDLKSRLNEEVKSCKKKWDTSPLTNLNRSKKEGMTEQTIQNEVLFS